MHGGCVLLLHTLLVCNRDPVNTNLDKFENIFLNLLLFGFLFGICFCFRFFSLFCYVFFFSFFLNPA